MKPKDCPSFHRCSAPLCPLDPTDLQRGIWYPGEPICRRQGGNGERWVAIQRRIQRKTRDAERGYFTVAMLSALAAVGRAIRGLDADSNDAAAAEAVWIAKKRRPLMSEGERQRRRERAFKAFQSAKDALSCNSDAKKVSQPIADETHATGQEERDKTTRKADA